MTQQDQPLKAEYDLRPATIEDIPFIFSSWLKSYRDAAAVQNVPNTIYYAQHHGLIQKILASPSLFIEIACDKEDANHVYAYIIGERTATHRVLHWAYTKYPFRNCGISKALFLNFLAGHAGEVTYTHAGKIVHKLAKSKSLIYNPYLVWSL